MNYGITIDHGTFKMNGRPFRAYGVNAYTMTLNLQTNPNDSSYKDGFAMLKKYNIPFIRIPMLWANVPEYERYRKDPESLFRVPDAILAEAARQKVGVILWIVNAAGFASMLGEKPSATGDVGSKTMAFMKELVRTAVKRYKDHPAVWGWEVWNEGNLFADVMQFEYPPLYAAHFGPQTGAFNGFDSVTSEEIMVAHREVAKAVREIDPYRMISTGNGLQREFAYTMHKRSQQMSADHVWIMDWTKDTLEGFRFMNQYFTPDPADAVCMHMGTPEEGFLYELSDTKLTNEALLKEYIAIAQSEGKAFYYGEFGNMAADANALDPAVVRQLFGENLRTIVKAGVQLGSLWQFNGNNDVFNDDGNLGYMFREISKVNDQFKEAGLQDLTGIW